MRYAPAITILEASSGDYNAMSPWANPRGRRANSLDKKGQ